MEARVCRGTHVAEGREVVPFSLSIPTQITRFCNYNAPLTSDKPHPGLASTPRTPQPCPEAVVVCFCLVGVTPSRQRRGVFFHAKKVFRRRNPIFARFAIVLNDTARSSEITRWIAPRLFYNYP